MPKTVEPDTQFVERLEWQLTSELRRRSRLRKAPARIAVPRPAALVAVLAGVLLTGVAAIKAAEFVQDSWRKKIEVARAETEVRLQEVRLESQSGLVAAAEKRAALGLVRQDEYRFLKIDRERAALDLERSQLNLKEVKRSGTAPRDELYAPLVGGRDFVAERLQIERREAERGLQILAARAEQLRERERLGLIAPDETRSAGRSVSARKARIEEIGKRLDLRRRYLAGEISALGVEVAGRLAAAQASLSAARSKVDGLKERAARAESLRQLGLVSAAETGDLDEALAAAEAEAKLAAVEVEVLEKVK
jgi:hypothetical protein